MDSFHDGGKRLHGIICRLSTSWEEKEVAASASKRFVSPCDGLSSLSIRIHRCVLQFDGKEKNRPQLSQGHRCNSCLACYMMYYGLQAFPRVVYEELIGAYSHGEIGSVSWRIF